MCKPRVSLEVASKQNMQTQKWAAHGNEGLCTLRIMANFVLPSLKNILISSWLILLLILVDIVAL